MFVKITSTLAVVAALTAAPALANEGDTASLTAAASATAAPVEAGAADNEFAELFESWEHLEQGGVVSTTGAVIPPVSYPTIAVPSRMPVEGVSLTSGFGMRDHPILRRRARHNGVDLAAPRGTPVYATADGLVEMAQYYSSYGNYVQIEHGGAIETRYAHLSSYTVSAGQNVRAGDLIGYIGSTGRSTGPHLHYEVRVEGSPVNPIPYMVADLHTDGDARAARGGPE